MAEDWSKVAAEVAGALAEVGDVTQPEGYPVTLRRAGSDAPANPWDPPGGTPTYTTLTGLVDTCARTDAAGTLIGQTVTTITVNATAGVVPSKSDSIALGITADEADESSAWIAIDEVRELKPAGVALLYDIDIIGGG